MQQQQAVIAVTQGLKAQVMFCVKVPPRVLQIASVVLTH